MSTDAPSSCANTSRSRRRHLARAGVVFVVLALTTGCQLRLATPEPTEPAPSFEETLRRTAVDDALTVRDQASQAAQTATDPQVAAALAQVADFATEHAAQLGGEYESGLKKTTTADPTPTPTSGATTETVIAALVEATTQAQQAADATDDGDLARLYASIGASDRVSAQRLATLTGTKASNTSSATVPPTAPRGLTATQLSEIVGAEDQAGYAGEVRAALLEGTTRAQAYSRAEVHRERAQAWADAAGIADEAADPRRIAYALPDDVASAAFAAQLETSLADDYASLVAHATSSSRLSLARLLADSALSAVAFGATPVALPGMPELDSSATPAPTASPTATG